MLLGRDLRSDELYDVIEPLHTAIFRVCHRGTPLRLRLRACADALGANPHSIGIYLFVPIAMVGRGVHVLFPAQTESMVT